jgi:hypothetical protein
MPRHLDRPLAGPLARLAGVTLAVGAATACDFKVTNPGPTLDRFLTDSLALGAQVNGVAYTLGDGLNYLALHSAVATRELFPTGQSGQFGIEPRNWMGFLVMEEQGTPWNTLQRARWLADQAVQRARTVLGEAASARHPQTAQALVWRGYTYRVLGEAMCVSIIDRGAPTPPRDNLVRAESSFTAAVAVATAAGSTALVNAAYAGRAQARLHLGDWAGAVADAGRVPTDYRFQLPYFANVDEYGYNRTMWSSSAESFYRAHSTWGTWYAAYYDATRDPRVRYERSTQTGAGAFPPVGRVPWWPQLKYTARTAPITLASGREMRLVEAEGALRTGDVATAMVRLDAVRTAAGAPTLDRPAGLTEAWALLKRERGIELWLEGAAWPTCGAGRPATPRVPSTYSRRLARRRTSRGRTAASRSRARR